MANEEFGPLAGLIGSWRGEGGVNVSYDYEQKKVIEETYTEEMTFKIVGDVDNGKQKIWCLDYITAAKRTGSDDIFHTELGFWGWDPARGEVMRCFMVPRMSTILAGGTAKADDTSFSLSAKIGAEDWACFRTRTFSRTPSARVMSPPTRSTATRSPMRRTRSWL